MHPVVDLLEMLGEDGRVVRACDYLRSWELLYDTGPSEYKAVRGAVYTEIPAETMNRIRLGKETTDDMLIASRCVIKQREWHQSVLQSTLTWPQWTCWRIENIKSSILYFI